MALPTPDTKLNVPEDWKPQASEVLETQATKLDEKKPVSALPQRVSERDTKGKKSDKGGKRKTRRHSKKTKRSRRHSRKH